MKNLFKQNKKEEVQESEVKDESAQVMTTFPEAEEAPVEEKDSSLNCSNCGGDGITGDLAVAGRHQICNKCQGTGKVS